MKKINIQAHQIVWFQRQIDTETSAYYNGPVEVMATRWKIAIADKHESTFQIRTTTKKTKYLKKKMIGYNL